MATDSVDFVQVTLNSSSTPETYTVPPATVAVLTDIDLASNTNVPMRMLLVVSNTAGDVMKVETLYTDVITAQWHGRRVFQAGDVITFAVGGSIGEVLVTAGGYLYT